MLKFKVRVRGIAPLLFNRYPDELNPEDKSKKKKARPTSEEDTERSLYRMKDKTIYQPSEHFIGSMIKASVNFKMEGKKTYKDLVKGGVFIEPLQIPHLLQEYTVDRRPVVIQRARVMKSRARMDKWELEFVLICIDDRAIAQDIEEILKYAGAYVGVGDYRPRYGRFEVVSMVEVK